MIKANSEYKVFKPREIQGKYIVFNVGNKQKDGSYFYVSIFAKLDQETIGLKDGDKMKIKAITGMDSQDFNGKKQVTLFCNVERLDKQDEQLESETQVLLTIDSSDLPF
jgi:hypothetical protein